jgi:hypothetical protein
VREFDIDTDEEDDAICIFCNELFFLCTILLLGFISTQCLIDITPITV